jgi:hypothetical protein
MKLNYDCVRDVLLALEESLTIDVEDDGDYSYNSLLSNEIIQLDRLSKYSKKDIIYSVLKLIEAGYLNGDIYNEGDGLISFCVNDIKYKGHEFLQAIKSDTVWEDVKKITIKIGSISLPIISSIASNVISKLISNAMGML